MARSVSILVAILVLLTAVIALPLLAQDGGTAAAPPPATAPAGNGNAPAMPSATPETPPAAAAPTPLETPAPAKLPVFGREFFRLGGGSFEPNPDAPVPSSYLLGAGDTLAIACWYGATEYERTTAPISPNGEIYLKRLGAVTVSNRTVAQVTDDLRQRYAKSFTKFELSVSVTGRRTIPIWVMGEVTKPGKYLLSSMATIFTALYAAGGPTDLGSLRAIRLMRNGKQIGADIDIYQYLLAGKDVAAPLEAGDTLFVPFTSVLVTLAGEVRRPALYELREEDRTLGAALLLAGGVTPDSAELVSVERVNAQHDRQTMDCTLPKDAKFALLNGDVVQVKAVPPPVKNAVAVQGAVYRPGQYSIEKAPGLAALLQLAGGVTTDAYLEQAIIKRTRADGTLQRLVVNLREALAPDAKGEQALEPGDVLMVYARAEVPELQDIVMVQGEVVKPGTYEFQPGMRVADVMKIAFGPTTQAYLDQAFLYRFPLADAPKLLPINLVKALAGDQAANVPLQSRDRLVVKSRAEVLDAVVRVAGEVEKPTSLPFAQGMRVSDAVFLAGGLKTNALLDRALLTRMNRATYTEELIEVSLREAMVKQPEKDLLLKEGDQLMVYPVSQVGEDQFVTVEGAVTAPGTYAYCGEMRVSHLLFLAKGLQMTAYAQRADLYRLRADNTVEILPVDLTVAMRSSLVDGNPLLKPRDRLRVVRRDEVTELPTVKIDGPVRTPGRYALTEGMKLSDLLHQAGGLKPDAIPTVEVWRDLDGKLTTSTYKTAMIGEKLTLAVDPFLKNHDLINVMINPAFRDPTDNYVILGEVGQPGSFPLYHATGYEPKTLYEVLRGVTLQPNAYVAGITLFRKQAMMRDTTQQTELMRYIRELDERSGVGRGNLATTAETDAAKAQTVQNLSNAVAQAISTENGESIALVIPPRSMQQQTFGLSLAIDAETLLRTNGKTGDVTLMTGDVIMVPNTPETVTVLGGVMNNGAVRYQPKTSIDAYVRQAGGLATDGERSKVVVLRMNGQVLPAKSVKQINPGDVIIVPTKYIVQTIHTRGALSQAVKQLSELALIALPFSK